MILAANQPYLLPYFPYWQLIHAADLFLVGDDYAYMKHSWINRNRIRMNGDIIYLRAEIRKKSSFRLIKDTSLAPLNRKEKLRTVEVAYHKAPFFQEGYALAERVFGCREENLCRFLTASIREVCGYLGIDTPLGTTSSLEGNALLRREERIYDFCLRLGATGYINAAGGQQLYRFEEFRRRGLQLNFLCSQAREAGTLSVLDAVMHHSRDELHTLLDHYTLLHG